MSTQIQITPASGITIGTTAVTSGTVGRVFFQGTGDVVQQDANFAFDSTLKRLTLKAVGTVATDIPLAIRNTTDTFNLFNVNGLGRAKFSFDSTDTNFIRIEPQLSEISMLSYGGLKLMSMTNSQSYFGFGVGGYKMGVGNNSPQARLDVRAQGALSTDIALRVRNSADTQNSFQIDGLGQGKIKSTSYTPKFSVSYNWAGGERDAFVFTQNIQNSRGQAWTFDAGYNGNAEGLIISNDLTGNDKGYFSIRQNNFNFGGVYHPAEFSSERKVLRIYNGVPPSARAVSETDFFKMYSADIVAGNAAPHFQTENNDVIKLYKQSSAGITTVADLVTVLTNLGLLA